MQRLTSRWKRWQSGFAKTLVKDCWFLLEALFWWTRKSNMDMLMVANELSLTRTKWQKSNRSTSKDYVSWDSNHAKLSNFITTFEVLLLFTPTNKWENSLFWSKAVKGSTTAFASLLDRMLAGEKIALCRFTPRAGAAPRFVALLPQVYFRFFHPLDKIGFLTTTRKKN